MSWYVLHTCIWVSEKHLPCFQGSLTQGFLWWTWSWNCQTFSWAWNNSLIFHRSRRLWNFRLTWEECDRGRHWLCISNVSSSLKGLIALSNVHLVRTAGGIHTLGSPGWETPLNSFKLSDLVSFHLCKDLFHKRLKSWRYALYALCICCMPPLLMSLNRCVSCDFTRYVIYLEPDVKITRRHMRDPLNDVMASAYCDLKQNGFNATLLHG